MQIQLPPSFSRQIIIPYAIAIGSTLLMLGLRALLDPLLGDRHPYVFFLFSVMLTSWFCGWKPAAVSMLLGVGLADYLFVDPRGSFGMDLIEQVIGLIGYFFVSITAIGLSESEHRAKDALQRANANLESRVNERTAQLEATNASLRQEMAERHNAEAKARRLAALVASSEDAVIGKDLEGTITDWNQGAERLYGYTADEVIGWHSSMLLPADRLDELARVADEVCRGEMVLPYETIRRRKDGSEVPVSVRMSPIKENGAIVGISTVSRDLTHVKKLEERLRQSQKLESIGQLAGGVAHDYNNLLTIINGYSEMLLSTRKLDPNSRELVDEIRRAGTKAASLTQQLLAFSRRQVLQPVDVDLNELVGHIEKTLGRLIGGNVHLATMLAPRLERVMVDPGQFQQVLVNLVMNAQEAMPQGGKLTLETANVELDDAYSQMHPEVWPGPYVLLAVSDTGRGMDEKTQAHLFEPFFTTKEFGKGIGLGLATIHGIVKQSGGHIAVYSELGRGTTFKIYLPVIDRRRKPERSHPERLASRRGAETILLVEDEDAVRNMTRMALRQSGYTVLEASHGGEAVRLAESYKGPIHLLLSDVVMPELGGQLLAERLTEVRPAIKVMFISGYTDNAVFRHGVLAEGVDFLQKPFSPGALARKVREVLDGKDTLPLCN